VRRFVVAPLPTRVVFGAGTLGTVRDEVTLAGLSRVLVLSTPGHAAMAEDIAARLGDLAAGTHPHAAMHVPAHVADAAARAAREAGADGCVAIGGGSAIGLAKAVALASDLPYVAVPTTYAGSEMTPIWGLTSGGEKRTGRDERVRPRTVLYDPDLTRTLPVAVSVTSAMNAVAHAVEALYAPDRSPLVSMLAAEGVRALTEALPAITEERERALYGAWLCGTCLGATTMSLHHKLCHTLGGTFDLPHAETHTVVLPHALAYNAAAAPEALDTLRDVLGTDDPARHLWELAGSLGAPRSLRELGLTDADVERAADLATRSPYANPAPVTPERVRALLRAALDGEPPADCPREALGAR
jgi:maleylacetate reductase